MFRGLRFTSFNPSQVQFTLKDGEHPITQNVSFNPSQVQFTPDHVAIPTKFKLKFQSLTGSIHTLNEEVQQQKESEFQSLTGSIHTIALFTINGKRITVSIPHRFNSHIMGVNNE